MIDVSHVSKKFGDFKVLSDISLQVPEGEIYGLIGYNGVGKTTLLKMISGIYRPDEGSIRINNAEIYENPTLKQRCFFMTEEAIFFAQASLVEMRRFYRGYYPTWSDEIFHGLTEWFGIDPHMKIGRFSKGMQRQASLTLAFSTQAVYLFLDEAFDGLDVTMRRCMREMLKYYAQSRKATLLISSHNLAELENLAQHIGMLNEGRLVFDGATERMRCDYQTCRFLFDDAPDKLNIPECQILETNKGEYSCVIHASQEEALRKLSLLGAKDIMVRPVQLEELFRTERKEKDFDWQEIFG